jgi:GNAT superfamily N-acetyltransferase
LLPEYRRHGLGTALLEAILDEGARRRLPVSIYVERFNPARALYNRLGFQLIEDQDVYLLMRWTPPESL